MKGGCVHILKSLAVIFFSLDIQLEGVLGDQAEIDNNLQLGKKHLQAGQLSEALFHYSAAVDADPSNYLTYFKRAAVYLAIGQAKKAIPDLDKAVELNKGFHQARLQRASTHLRLGDLDRAEEDYRLLAASASGSVQEDAGVQVELIPTIRSYVQTAQLLIEKKDYSHAVNMLDEAVETCPWDSHLREMRSKCNENIGQFLSAISDMKMLTKLVHDNTDTFYRISMLYFVMGEEEDSLREIRECLRLDPDHKECFPHYKKVKKLDKKLKSAQELLDNGRYHEAAEKYHSILSSFEDTQKIHAYLLRIRSKLCHCYSKIGNLEVGKEWCGLALELESDNVDALCDRAELFINNQMYEEAIKDYQTANGVENHPQKVDDGLNRAQKLLKQSQKRDYYKILGVSRTATKGEIMKAYRRLARDWHPDSYEGDDEEMAEKMFLDLAAAKEVLSDPEMRQQFDNGEDPLDHQTPNHQHNPFGGFGGGGPFTFKFKYN
ncbi:dnaJ homolog subfamily C member 3-like [Halichondria panicea]|uniref:dnaJ homolog subfamily C member 3-like n=1 Tax=Halichondria panicea TaxID=6063 RepID=UPI00312B3A1B